MRSPPSFSSVLPGHVFLRCQWKICLPHTAMPKRLQRREHVLDDLDDLKIYIIGGLMDQQRWNRAALDKAKKQGIAKPRLLDVARFSGRHGKPSCGDNPKILGAQRWIHALLEVMGSIGIPCVRPCVRDLSPCQKEVLQEDGPNARAPKLGMARS